jgi:hypothetical protein
MEKYISYASEFRSEQFYDRSEYSRQQRRFSLSVSYRFGELKQQIRKVQRGIVNDDVEKSNNNTGVDAGK